MCGPVRNPEKRLNRGNEALCLSPVLSLSLLTNLACTLSPWYVCMCIYIYISVIHICILIYIMVKPEQLYARMYVCICM